MTRSQAAVPRSRNRTDRAGDAELERVLTRNLSRVLARVRAMLGDGTRRSAESIDHLQDAVVEVLREVEHVELADEDQLVRRLAAIARNNIRDAGRRRREQGFESLSMTWNDPSAHSVGETSPRSQASRREQALLVAHALERLSDAERRVVELRSFERLSFAEIATRLGRREDAVRKQYHRAIVVLGRRLSD